MFDALRSIRQQANAAAREEEEATATPHRLGCSSPSAPHVASTADGVFQCLCHLHRRQRAALDTAQHPPRVETHAADASHAAARLQVAALSLAYARPLASVALTPSTGVSTAAVTDAEAELQVVADALPQCTLWGSVLRMWAAAAATAAAPRGAGGRGCPTLRALVASDAAAAATAAAASPSVLSQTARVQRVCAALRECAPQTIGRVLDAAALGTASRTRHVRKRQRSGAEAAPAHPSPPRPFEAIARGTTTTTITSTASDSVPTDGGGPVMPPTTAPLRATSARAQVAAAASRSRSRTRTPPARSRSRSPAPPSSSGLSPARPTPATAIATTAAGPTTRPSAFSFGVRTAATGAAAAAAVAPHNPSPPQQPVSEPSDDVVEVVAGASRVGGRSARLHDVGYPLQQSQQSVPPGPLRQTTLAAFTLGGLAPPPPLPPPAQPACAPLAPPPPPPPLAEAAASASVLVAKRPWWYNPSPPPPPPHLAAPPQPSKAPPYEYDLRQLNNAGNASSTSHSASDNRHARAPPPPPRPASPLAAPAPASSGGNSGGGAAPPAGGFVTAGEQLLADVRQGRAMSSAYLSKRSPALGLRRNTGFQPPYHAQQQQAAASNAIPSAATDVHGVLSAITAPPAGKAVGGGKTGAKGPASAAHGGGGGNDEDDAGTYPASLLLPDGTVPPILLPLDPKLVTQVAMEILEHGAGARQVGWDDIAGLQHAKASVEEAIVWPLRRPDLFVGLRDPPRGLLLFGPPGTGKTMIARAIANRAACTFLNISSSSLMSKWMGDGEKLVRCLFAVATVKQPSVIFIDEIDSLLSMRGEGEMDSVRRVKTEFLVQLDGVATDRGDRVLLIGATNRPDELDEAARRRMEKRLYIPLPDAAARRELIQRLLRSLGPSDVRAPGAPAEGGECDSPGESAAALGGAGPPSVAHTLTDADLDQLVRNTEGYSGADLKQLCREAAMGPLREMSVLQLSAVAAADLRPVQRKDFKQALRRLKPSVGPAEVQRYVEWNGLFGSFNEHESDDDDDDAVMEDGDGDAHKCAS